MSQDTAVRLLQENPETSNSTPNLPEAYLNHQEHIEISRRELVTNPLRTRSELVGHSLPVANPLRTRHEPVGNP